MGVRKEELKVGIFVVLGLVVLMGSLIVAGADKVFFRSYVELHTEFKHVQGLSPGSSVSLAGIPIGNVGRIEFLDAGKGVRVYMDIESKFMERITNSSRASIKTQGALGDKYIYVTPGSRSETSLADGSKITTDEELDFIDVITERGPELANVIDVINELHTLLKNINGDGRSAKISNNLAEASTELRSAIKEARLTMSDLRGDDKEKKRLREAVTHLSSILEKVDSGEGTLGALVNNSTLHERLIGLLGEKPRNKYLKPLIRKTIKDNEESKSDTN